MADVIKHTFVSEKADGADEEKVRPSNWNEEHEFAGGSDGEVLVRDSAETDGGAWARRDQVLNSSTTAVGNVGGGEDTMQTYTLPAGTLGADGRALRIIAKGYSAANANTKTIKLFFGTQSVTLGPTVTAPNALAWSCEMIVKRTAAATQEIFATAIIGTTLEVMSRTAGTQDLAAAVTIKATGESGSSADNDVVQTVLIVELLN